MKYCSIADCNKKHDSHGYCSMHGTRMRRHKDVGLSGSMHELHGGAYTPEYISWQMMKRRCLAPNHKNYKYYGGRGITIYEPWIKSFTLFLEHLGKRPNDTYSLDRIDPNGNYEPGNVRWADRSTQSLNRRPYNKYKGVYKLKNCNLWEANLSYKGKRLYRERFKTEEQAHLARLAAEIKYLGYNV